MILADYLARERETLASFAARTGRKVTTVHAWMTGARIPPLRAVQAIEKATGGEVSLGDWMRAQRRLGDAKRDLVEVA